MRKNVRLPFLSMLIIIGISLSACANKIDTNMSEQMADIEFITQNNKPITTQVLFAKNTS